MAASANVFTLADLGPLTILEAGPELPQHKHSPYPPLADERVRYVGQPHRRLPGSRRARSPRTLPIA